MYITMPSSAHLQGLELWSWQHRAQSPNWLGWCECRGPTAALCPSCRMRTSPNPAVHQCIRKLAMTLVPPITLSTGKGFHWLITPALNKLHVSSMHFIQYIPGEHHWSSSTQEVTSEQNRHPYSTVLFLPLIGHVHCCTTFVSLAKFAKIINLMHYVAKIINLFIESPAYILQVHMGHLFQGVSAFQCLQHLVYGYIIILKFFLDILQLVLFEGYLCIFAFNCLLICIYWFEGQPHSW